MPAATTVTEPAASGARKSPLIYETIADAAAAGDARAVCALVERGARVNAAREDRSGPLLLAAHGGHEVRG